MSRSEDGMTSTLRPPEPLGATHDLSAFSSGVTTLDDWLRRRALRNESSGASRTYVVCQQSDSKVVGYYALAAGAVAHSSAPPSAKRNMPDPLPVMVLGRLAVDQACQGKGLGRALLRDAILRTLQAASIVGIRAILVHAISPEARKFYEHCGFRLSPIDPLTLMITLAEAERALGGD